MVGCTYLTHEKGSIAFHFKDCNYIDNYLLGSESSCSVLNPFVERTRIFIRTEPLSRIQTFHFHVFVKLEER